MLDLFWFDFVILMIKGWCLKHLTKMIVGTYIGILLCFNYILGNYLRVLDCYRVDCGSESVSLSVMSDSFWPHGLYSPPGSSVPGILQARILGLVAFSSSGDLPNPGIEPMSPTLQADSLLSESPGQNGFSPFKIVVSVWGQNFCFFRNILLMLSEICLFC